MRGNWERVGQRQHAVLLRARRSAGRHVMPGGFLERRACKRLEVRGLMRSAHGFPDVWTLTALGLVAWLVVT